MKNGFEKLRSGPLIAAAILLGIGMGGFLDGILLHQILQWHQMLSNKIPPETVMNQNINMFWDGVFHLFTWTMTLLGIILLWRLDRRVDVVKSARILTGGMVLGWGLFNATDSILNHYIFQFHNVREKALSPALWNAGFLLFAVALIACGWLMIRSGKKTLTSYS